MMKILKYGQVGKEEIFGRQNVLPDLEDTVAEIIKNVRENGDNALRFYSEKFDHVVLPSFEVTEEEIKEAVEAIDPAFYEVLREAAENIRRFHSRQIREGFVIKNPDGSYIGQKITPVDRAGLYVPGGTALYPSTVLMDAIPAVLAGCREVIMVSPPQKNGKIDPMILAAASVAGVSRIFKIGGAQAIAALAYGTESVPKVDKIVGPGNAFVAEAKKQVFGRVSIDMIAGPSEILVVADGKSDPVFVAADLLSQAEHDRMASAVLITDSNELAVKVQAEVERQLALLPRREIAAASVETNGKIIVTDSIQNAIELSNEIAPEHLELCLDDPEAYLPLVRHAGSVFLGRYCPEALGDYFGGPNHTLPTMGTAKFSSPLSVDDFIKKTQYTYYTKEAFLKVADKIGIFARQEGLEAHARSALSRKEEKE